MSMSSREHPLDVDVIDLHVDDVRRLLLEENLQIAGDITTICTGVWAIHGVIPVDGEVIVAEFDAYDTARAGSTHCSATPWPLRSASPPDRRHGR